MAATVHVVARFVAKPGKEEALKTVLTALIAADAAASSAATSTTCSRTRPTRATSASSSGGRARSRSTSTATPQHVRQALSQVEGLVEAPPDIRRYHQI